MAHCLHPLHIWQISASTTTWYVKSAAYRHKLLLSCIVQRGQSHSVQWQQIVHNGKVLNVIAVLLDILCTVSNVSHTEEI